MKLKLINCIKYSIVFFYTFSFSQRSDDLINWQLKGSESNFPGTGAEELYKKLKTQPSYEVIVAVIDGGVDIHHEDLKQNIWVNRKEIPGNGIDDDKNGYIDDIYGWNFLGNAKGENIQYDTYETTRTLARLSKKYKNTKPESVPKDQQVEYQRYLEIKKI